jgi:hypothetical protein
MTTQLSPRPVATTPAPESLEAVIAAAGRRGRLFTDLTAVLLRYWHELPRHDLSARGQLLGAIRTRVRSGELAERAFAAFALGDGDEDIVAVATAEYIGTHPVSVEWRQAAIDDALEWIRRGLPLNRGAVFAALLGLNDPDVNERLAALRLILGYAEVATVCRRAVARPAAVALEFLADWLQLLQASEARDERAESLLARALEA